MDPLAAKWEHCLEYAAASDVGLRRANNQDSMAVQLADSQEAWEKKGHLFMVADGMGAHAAGELASKLATDVVTLTYHKLADRSPPQAIHQAVNEANERIHRRGEGNPEFKGMGTTATTLVLLPEGAMLAHVGDSRAYRLRGDRFEQLTFDHSLVWEMQAAGQFEEGQVPSHIPSNIITRSLGPNAAVQVDMEGPFPLQRGDTFLLCSDGLSGQVNDDEMGAILDCLSPVEAVRALIDLANLRGGPDNITIVVARVTGPQVAVGDVAKRDPEEQKPTAKPINPLIWIALGVCTLAALGLAGMGYYPLAGIAALGAVGAGIGALVQRFSSDETARFGGRMLGKGPYRACVRATGKEFIQRVTEIVQNVRDAAMNGSCEIDWQRVNAFQQHAAEAEQNGDFSQATREYFRAISFMMQEIKASRRQKPSDDENVLG